MDFRNAPRFFEWWLGSIVKNSACNREDLSAIKNCSGQFYSSISTLYVYSRIKVEDDLTQADEKFILAMLLAYSFEALQFQLIGRVLSAQSHFDLFLIDPN